MANGNDGLPSTEEFFGLPPLDEEEPADRTTATADAFDPDRSDQLQRISTLVQDVVRGDLARGEARGRLDSDRDRRLFDQAIERVPERSRRLLETEKPSETFAEELTATDGDGSQAAETPATQTPERLDTQSQEAAQEREQPPEERLRGLFREERRGLGDIEPPSTEEFFGLPTVEELPETPERFQREPEQPMRFEDRADTEEETEQGATVDRLFDDAIESGRKLEVSLDQFREDLPENLEKAGDTAIDVVSSIKSSITSGDALKGLSRGVIGFSTSIGSGLLKAPSAGEVAGLAIEQIPGLEDEGRAIREFQDIDALEDLGDALSDRGQESREIIGEPETATGITAEILTRLGLELSSFVGAGQALRAGAGQVAGSNLGRLSRAAAKLSNPQSVLTRIGQDFISGNAVDYLIGVSGVENASIPFLEDISKKKKVRRGMEERGIDSESVIETLEWLNANDQRRGFGEALLGSVLELGFEGVRGTFRGGRSILGRAADEDAVEVLGRAEAEEATEGTERAAREVEVEPSEVGEPTRVREKAPIEGEPGETPRRIGGEVEEPTTEPALEDLPENIQRLSLEELREQGFEQAARQKEEAAEAPARTGTEADAERALEELPDDLQGLSASDLRERGFTRAAEQKQAEVEGDIEDFFRGEPEEEVAESVQTGRSGAEAADEATTTTEREAAPEAAETRPEEPGEGADEVTRRTEELGDREVDEPIEGAATGAVRTVKNADGSEVLTQYKVVDAAEIETSHAPLQGFAPRADFPDGIQERRYHADDDAKSFVIENARELDPDQVLDGTPRPTDGPPIITTDGVALGGNARSMMLKTAYARHPDRAAAYKDELIERADRFGLGAQRDRIRDMEAPVLVRQVADPDVDPSDRGQLAELGSKFNDVPTRSRDPLGEARTRARRLRENTDALEFYGRNIGSDETLRSFLNRSDGRRWVQRLVEEGTIRPQAATEFRLDDGTITDEGKTALERMLFAAVVDDPEVLARAPKSVLRDLTHAVPPLVRVQSVAGFDIGPQVREALDFLHRWRNSDVDTLEEFIAQGTIFEEADERTVALARFLNEENRSTIKAGFRKYAQDAQEADGQRQADDLFGREPISDEEAFEKRFVDRTHAPEIPGLRGGATGEEGFINPDLQSAIARTGTGFLFGALTGGQFGNTPEQKLRNSMLVGGAGAVGANVLKFGLRRLGPDEWNLPGRVGDFASRVIKKGGKTDPDDPFNLREFLRESYRQIWRSRKPVEEVSNAAHKRVRGRIPEEQDPAVWMQLFSSSGEHAQEALRYGPHRPGTTIYRTQRGLAQLMEEVGPRQDELNLYGVLRRTLEDLEPRGFFEPDADITTDIDGPVPFEEDEARRLMETHFGRVVEPGGEVVERGDEQLAEWFEEYNRIDDAWYVIMEEVGVLRSGSAARIRGENPNYWPMERDVPPDVTRKFGQQRGFGVREPGPPTREFTGSEARILNPIETAYIQHFRYSDLMFRQMVFNTLAQTAELADDVGHIRPIDPPQERRNIAGERLQAELPDHVAAEVEDEVYEVWLPRRVTTDDPVFRAEMPDGRVQHFEVSQELAEALQGMSPDRLRAWSRLMRPFAKALRLGVTSMADFMFANASRDLNFRAITDPRLGEPADASFARHLFGGSQKALFQASASAVRAISELMSTQLGISEASELERLWRSTGGPFGFMDIDRDNINTELMRLRREGEGPLAFAKHPMDAIRYVFDRIRGIGVAFENFNRFAQMLDIARASDEPTDINTVLRGAMAGKDATVDFSLQGADQTVRELRAVSSFWGARMQGEDKLRRMLFEEAPEFRQTQPREGRRKKVWAHALGTITLGSLGLYAINRQNDDYWQTNLWERNFTWMVPLPGLDGFDLPEELVNNPEERFPEDPAEFLSPFAKRGSTTWLRVPKPFTLGWMFGSTPVRFIEAFDPANPFRDEGISGRFRFAAEEVGQMLQDFIPIPTGLKPVMENFANYDFHLNYPVINKFEAAQRKPERLKGRESASEFAKNIADVTHALPGDFLDMTGPGIDNLIFDWGGGAGRASVQLVDILGRPEHHGQRPEGTITEIPVMREFLGRFVREGDRYSPRSVAVFYDRLEESTEAYKEYRQRIEKAERRVRALRRQGRDVRFNEMPEVGSAQQIYSDNLEAVLKRDIYREIADEMTLVRKARTNIRTNPTMTTAQKDQALSNLRNIAGFLTSLGAFKPEDRRELLKGQTFEPTDSESIPILGDRLPQRYRKWAREIGKAEAAVRRVNELRQQRGLSGS